MHNGALLDACGSLVTYIESTGVIILSHFSVKEYLMGESTRSKLPRYYINWELAHLHLARSCMCYISICCNHIQRRGRTSNPRPHVPDVSPDRGDHLHVISQPLRDHTPNHATDHFGHLGPQIDSILHDIKVLERDIQTHSRMWDNMCLSATPIMGLTRPGWPTSRHDFTLYILVAFGPNSALLKFLRRTELKPKEGTNPLVYAAYFNKVEHTRTLLSREARLNYKGWETYRLCQVLPIEIALRNHNYDTVTLFVAEGSPVPPRIFTMVYDPGYPKFPSGVVKILLQTDDFMESVNSSPTELLSFMGRFLNSNNIDEEDRYAIIRRIIQVGYPFGATYCQDTLIPIAVRQGHVAVVRDLLSLGVSLPSDVLVTLNLEHMQNAMHMIRYLVVNGANTLAHNQRGDSVLRVSLATFEEPEALETARLLVAHDCDPLQANSRGETPLHIAIQRELVSVVHYLLSIGVPFSSGPLTMSSLWRMQNRARMIRSLVENGADPLTLSIGGEPLLHVVLADFSERDALETAKFLVAHGYDPLEANSRGKTPLHIAFERSHVSVARYLLCLGAPPSTDQLMPSISRGMRDGARIIRFLVENGLDVLSRTGDGDSLLHIAVDTFHDNETLETTKFLVAHGYDPLEANSHGETPLHIAVQQGLVSVVQYFLSLGVRLPCDLLALLRSWGMVNSARMIRFLVENGFDVLSHTGSGDSLLHIVVVDNLHEDEALETTKLLVTRGCDPLEANSHGEIPLHIAVQQGLVSVVHYFLSLGVPLPCHLLSLLRSRRMVNSPRVIRCLVENGFDALSRTGSGDSLLHIVVAGTSHEAGALETVPSRSWLRSAGSRFSRKNTPSHCRRTRVFICCMLSSFPSSRRASHV
ncbi:ankyrin [Imleria badia]|nr:ankyrin [Imleria badia]